MSDTKRIEYLELSYPNFTLGQIIDPEEANQNNNDIVNKVNEFVDEVKEALDIAEESVLKSNQAIGIADESKTIAEIANAKSDGAILTSNQAVGIANQAVDVAEGVESNYNILKPELEQAIEDANILVDHIVDIIDSAIDNVVGTTTNTGVFVANTDGATTFTIPLTIYNPLYDYLTLEYKGIVLREEENYIRDNRNIVLGFELKQGENVYYRISKNILIDPTLSDGGLLMDGSVSEVKLAQEVQDKIQVFNTHLAETSGQLTSHMAETASINAIGHVYAAEFTATLSTSWSGSAAPYTQTITINGITSSHNPIIDVVMSGTYSTDQQRSEQWGYIYRAVTGTNQITFYASGKPTVSLPIRVKVVA